MITLSIGTFICIVGCTFVVGGVVGLILTASGTFKIESSNDPCAVCICNELYI